MTDEDNASLLLAALDDDQLNGYIGALKLARRRYTYFTVNGHMMMVTRRAALILAKAEQARRAAA